jgi:peroxiredoxin Q/BCP
MTRTPLALASAALFLCACGHDDAPPPATPTAATTAVTTATGPTAAAPGPATTSTAIASATPTATAATASSTDGLTVGAPAPDFTATAASGASIHIAALKGKPVVVYFYPKDETEGCTKEACSFRDAWSALSNMGVVLIGISGDTDDSHRGFADNHKLPFHLVSDPNGTIAALYGVPFKNGYAARQSFVIGPDGNIKKIYRHVDVTVHAAEIARDVKP